MSKIYDVIILGAGPAGLTAGLYAGRSRLSTLILEKGQDGGQIAITNEIENYPGQQLEGESGPSLIARMTAQAEKFGVERARDSIKSVELTGEVKKLTGMKGEYLAKTVILATGAFPRPIGCKNEGKFVGNAIVMPTDTEASNLSLTYSVNGTDYTSTPAGRIAANGQYELATTVEAGSSSSKVNLNSAITYAAWDSTVVNLSDSFTIDETTPDKQWMGPTALPISGTAAPGYDNFWASSDGGDSGWGETFWQYNLYDGNKTDGSNYWCPAEWDRTAPIWYIDLGAAKQGVTIDYWNKAGGKGGQKIKTMDIYASNTRADYGGGNADWVKIMTFTSDKTTPTTDAGAQVTTGKIAFSEDGSVSYQYVKCVMTSKVNIDGATITDVLDVNVGELEVSTWEYK